MSRKASVIAIFLAVGSLGVPVHAGYIISLQSGGSPSQSLQPGGTFTLDVLLDGDPGTVHNSAIFQIIFSAPSLLYQSYEWASPYGTGNIFDASSPFIDDLPVVLTEDLLSGPGYPEGVVNIELANVVPIPGVSFSTGLLVSLTLTVPQEWDGPSLIEIFTLPDTFADGFDVVSVAAGPAFQLFIVPAPSCAAILFGLMAGPRRRRCSYRT